MKKAAGLMVQRIYRILGETAADCHYTGCGMCRYGLPLWNLYIIKHLVNPNVPMGFSALMAAVVFFRRHDHDHAGTDRGIWGRILYQHEYLPQYVIREKIHLGEEDR